MVDDPLSISEFLAWEAEARTQANAMLAQCLEAGDTLGAERARAFQAQIDRAARVVMGRRDHA